MKQLDIVNQVYAGTDAYEATQDDQTDLFSFLTEPEFTQGEVVCQYFIPLLDYVKPKPGEVFYDLGCGAGKPLLIASLAFPNLKICKGIEYLDGVASMASEIMVKAQDKCTAEGLEFSPIEVQ